MTPAVKVENLNFSFNAGSPVLSAVTFEVPEGECLGLIGPNGAGKSTLLLHLNGILPEKKSGRPSVFIFGEPVADEGIENIRRAVGFLFQNPDDQLFCPTVYEDVAFGPKQFGMPDSHIAASSGVLRTISALAKNRGSVSPVSSPPSRRSWFSMNRRATLIRGGSVSSSISFSRSRRQRSSPLTTWSSSSISARGLSFLTTAASSRREGRERSSRTSSSCSLTAWKNRIFSSTFTRIPARNDSAQHLPPNSLRCDRTV